MCLYTSFILYDVDNLLEGVQRGGEGERDVCERQLQLALTPHELVHGWMQQLQWEREGGKYQEYTRYILRYLLCPYFASLQNICCGLCHDLMLSISIFYIFQILV